MKEIPTRRDFLKCSAAAGLLPSPAPAAADGKVRVVVWDERQPEQKEAYPGFLGDWIARHLETRAGFAVRSVGLDDPQQGLSDAVLGACDVLLWWGHRRQAEVAPRTGEALVGQIK